MQESDAIKQQCAEADAASTLRYQSGFGSEFATEALAGALPHGQNSPQNAPYGLYSGQLSRTAFTAPRHSNRRSWVYRIRPAAMHEAVKPAAGRAVAVRSGPVNEVPTPPKQLPWGSFSM